MGAVTRVGVLGTGFVVEQYHLPVLSEMPDVHVEWVCDVVGAQAQRVAAAFGVPRVFEGLEQCTDVDLVLIAIPVGNRRRALECIFKRGWHAFCEKPFAVTAEEHDWIVGSAAASQVQVGAGLMRRVFPEAASTRDGVPV